MKEYTHLSPRDRRRLFIFLTMGIPIREIAQRLEKHRSTIYREIKRNQEEGCYLPIQAQEKMRFRQKRYCNRKLERNGSLRDYVIRALKKGWSPEQISGRMKYKRLSYYVCPETIYQYIYHEEDKILCQYLTQKKLKRRRRYGRIPHTCRYGEIRLITQRPEEVMSRKRFGQWEGDLIEFSGTKQKTVTTLVERKSRIVILLKNDNKSSKPVINKIKEKLMPLPDQMCQSITFDQGSEFAQYVELERGLNCKVYYCHPQSPWQKGSNENMNGRLRRYLPRTVAVEEITQLQLDELAAKMNRCPRKCIGFKTPQELFIQQYKNDCRTWS